MLLKASAHAAIRSVASIGSLRSTVHATRQAWYCLLQTPPMQLRSRMHFSVFVVSARRCARLVETGAPCSQPFRDSTALSAFADSIRRRRRFAEGLPG